LRENHEKADRFGLLPLRNCFSGKVTLEDTPQCP